MIPKWAITINVATIAALVVVSIAGATAQQPLMSTSSEPLQPLEPQNCREVIAQAFQVRHNRNWWKPRVINFAENSMGLSSEEIELAAEEAFTTPPMIPEEQDALVGAIPSVVAVATANPLCGESLDQNFRVANKGPRQ